MIYFYSKFKYVFYKYMEVIKIFLNSNFRVFLALKRKCFFHYSLTEPRVTNCMTPLFLCSKCNRRTTSAAKFTSNKLCIHTIFHDKI